MSRAIRSLMVLVLSFSFVSCSQRPVFTVEIIKTLTLPVETPTIASAATTHPSLPVEPALTATLPAETPTFVATPTPPQMPSNFSPIMYGKKFDSNTFFILLGGLLEGLWVAPDLTFANFSYLHGWEYDVYTKAKGKYQVRGDPPEFSPPYRIYTVSTDAALDEVGMVAVAEGWPTLQRDVQELEPDHELYRQAVLDWLVAEDVDEPVLGALQILRVDIEGDGVDEIFISATHLDESQHMTRQGDYSLVLMRKVVGNEIVTRSIVGDIYHSAEAQLTYPRTYSLANFLDLNQDGFLEVIIDIQGWEKAGAIVYQIDGEDVIETLRVE